MKETLTIFLVLMCLNFIVHHIIFQLFVFGISADSMDLFALDILTHLHQLFLMDIIRSVSKVKMKKYNLRESLQGLMDIFVHEAVVDLQSCLDVRVRRLNQ